MNMADNTQSRLMDHILAVYDYMDDHSIDRAGDPIFEGMTTQVITACGLSNNYYTPVFRFLKGGNYVTQIKRGGGGSMSMYQLNGRPDPDDFDDVLKSSGAQNTAGTKSLKAVSDMKMEIITMRRIVDQHSKILLTLQTAIVQMSNKVYGVGNDLLAPTEDENIPTLAELDAERFKPKFEEPNFEELSEDGNIG
jgi:hypothetical protein